MTAAFVLAWRGLWRGKTLWLLLAAVVAAHVVLPDLARSDGSPAGMLEMRIRVVCGAIAALVYVASLALACGSFSREREDDLLPLSLVRPVSAFSVAAGRWLALLLLMACVLAANALCLNIALGAADSAPGDCRLHREPTLPPVEVTAAAAMEAFLKSDKTPEAVKKSPRAAILSLLAAKEMERYEVIRPGRSASWPFDAPRGEALSVRARFSTMYNMKEPLSGVFRYRGRDGAVSNSTQAILEVPLRFAPGDVLRPFAAGGDVSRDLELTFTNTGATDVMLRPRRDVELLSPGDSFLANSLRASVEMLALAGLLAAFGLFLSAGLSRPVALFTAAVLLASALMAPDAVSQVPDEFNATFGERAGLAISRAVTRFTAALSEISPVSDMASGRAIPLWHMLRVVVADLVAWPLLFFALSAFVIRRKVK